MDTMAISSYNNQPKHVEIRDDYVWVTVQDGRILGAPLDWFPWLQDATSQQQANYTCYGFSIDWDELDDGIDMQMMVGNYGASKNLVTPEQLANMHNIAPNTVYRLLRREADLDEDQKRLPGAFKEAGNKQHAQWYIPRESAEAFVPSKSGRKATQEPI